MEDNTAFDYALPKERIASWPRVYSKLLCARRNEIQDSLFQELPKILKPNDLLVLNDSKVLPYRFIGTLNGSNAEIEILLLPKEDSSSKYFEALAKPMRKLKLGAEVQLREHLVAVVCGRSDDRRRVVLELFNAGDSNENVGDLLLNGGLMPIPPYIRGGRADKRDEVCYQTVYAKHPGSVAAPTAGLHFTNDLLCDLEKNGIQHCFLTLHVGAASFASIEHTAPSTPEYYSIPKSSMERIEEAKTKRRRIVAVGTTTVKALETEYSMKVGEINTEEPRSDGFRRTTLFISPGYQFKVVDSIITNFHQPASTHLSLVSAFFGKSRIKNIYDHALCSDYKFLSYGDAMFLDKEYQR